MGILIRILEHYNMRISSLVLGLTNSPHPSPSNYLPQDTNTIVLQGGGGGGGGGWVQRLSTRITMSCFAGINKLY